MGAISAKIKRHLTTKLLDYLICFDALFPHVDYFVVNVSSPNTQTCVNCKKKPLTALLQTLHTENHKRKNPKPILLKIAPDLTDTQLLDIIDIVSKTNTDGVIATNTTIARDGLQSDSEICEETGGLRGNPQ